MYNLALQGKIQEQNKGKLQKMHFVKFSEDNILWKYIPVT